MAKAKGELFARLGETGVAVINADDTFAPLWRELAGDCRVMEFGLQGAEITADWQGDTSGSDVRLHTPAGSVDLRLPLPGRHNVMNALAACAVALAAGAGLDAVRQGLESLSPVAGRCHLHSLPGGITLIDDTYHANPESLQVALDVLAQADGDSWLVLGDMGELGSGAAALHGAAGRMAREAGVTRLYGLGELAQTAVAAFDGPGGAFDSMDELLATLHNELSAPRHILVKGSRRMRMERVIAALKMNPEAGELH